MKGERNSSNQATAKCVLLFESVQCSQVFTLLPFYDALLPSLDIMSHRILP